MVNFYYFKDGKEGLKKTLAHLQKSTKSLAIYQPVACENGVCALDECAAMGVAKKFSFSTQEAVEAYLADKNAFFKQIINDYAALAAEHDFVLVNSFAKFGELGALQINCELAKQLNLPIYAEPCEGAAQKIAYARAAGCVVYEDAHAMAATDFCTPMAFEALLERKARENIKTVVLPEGGDDRVLRAADALLKGGAVKLIILGNNQAIAARAAELGLELDAARTINPGMSQYDDELALALFKAREAKGMTQQKAAELIKDPNYFGTMLVHCGHADAMVSGAACTTADTIRPALQVIKTKPGAKGVSGGFFMCLEDRVHYYADCAVTPNPTPEQLADIANTSAQTFAAFGFSPRVALLSYSTKGSGSGPSVDATEEAVRLAAGYEGLVFDGPLQFDASVDAATAAKKAPNSAVAGRANVFVFPDLNAANICYKAVQRTAGAIAVGPVLQGLNKPINDLSRGCLVADIVNTVLLSAIQAQN